VWFICCSVTTWVPLGIVTFTCLLPMPASIVGSTLADQFAGWTTVLKKFLMFYCPSHDWAIVFVANIWEPWRRKCGCVVVATMGDYRQVHMIACHADSNNDPCKCLRICSTSTYSSSVAQTANAGTNRETQPNRNFMHNEASQAWRLPVQPYMHFDALLH